MTHPYDNEWPESNTCGHLTPIGGGNFSRCGLPASDPIHVRNAEVSENRGQGSNPDIHTLPPLAPEPQVSAFVCGGDACPKGGEHDNLGRQELLGPSGTVCGESVACSKCGSSAFERDMLRLP